MALGLLLLGAISPARGAEGRIPIFEPTVLFEPGHYVVVRDFSSTTAAGIAILSSDVTVDLGGHTITVIPPFSGVIVFNGYTNITIRNGRIEGGLFGVFHNTGSTQVRIRIEHVEVSGSAGDGIVVPSARYVEVLSCRVHEAGGHGILVSGTAVVARIVDNAIDTAVFHGIKVENAEASEIRGNRVRNAGTGGLGEGIVVNGGNGGNRIVGNEVRDCASDGIRLFTVDHNLVRDNVVTGNQGDGLEALGEGNLITGNVAAGNAGMGLRLSAAESQNLVAGNQATGNGISGIYSFGEHNLIQGNLCQSNATWGIDFGLSTGHAYRDNMLRDNGISAVGNLGTATDEGGNVQ